MSGGTDAALTADGFPVMTLQRFLTLMVVAVCPSQPALAQINPTRGSGGMPLNRDDIAAQTDATYRRWIIHSSSPAPLGPGATRSLA